MLSGLALAVLLTACTTGPLENCPEDPLVERVRQEGTLRVLVTLELDVTPEAELTEQEVEEQRRRIDEIQDQLLAELEGTDAEVVRRFERFAMLSLRVGEPAVCRLLTSQLVRDVQEETAEPPTGSGA